MGGDARRQRQRDRKRSVIMVLALPGNPHVPMFPENVDWVWWHIPVLPARARRIMSSRLVYLRQPNKKQIVLGL